MITTSTHAPRMILLSTLPGSARYERNFRPVPGQKYILRETALAARLVSAALRWTISGGRTTACGKGTTGLYHADVQPLLDGSGRLAERECRVPRVEGSYMSLTGSSWETSRHSCAANQRGNCHDRVPIVIAR